MNREHSEICRTSKAEFQFRGSSAVIGTAVDTLSSFLLLLTSETNFQPRTIVTNTPVSTSNLKHAKKGMAGPFDDSPSIMK